MPDDSFKIVHNDLADYDKLIIDEGGDSGGE